MRYLISSLFLLVPFVAVSNETRPTTVTPTTVEQKETHRDVAKKQEILKKKLVQRASPEEIHKAKGEVQKSRVKANEADLKAGQQEP